MCRLKLHWKIWYTETHTEKYYKRRFYWKLHWIHTFVIQERKKPLIYHMFIQTKYRFKF